MANLNENTLPKINRGYVSKLELKTIGRVINWMLGCIATRDCDYYELPKDRPLINLEAVRTIAVRQFGSNPFR